MSEGKGFSDAMQGNGFSDAMHLVSFDGYRSHVRCEEEVIGVSSKHQSTKFWCREKGLHGHGKGSSVGGKGPGIRERVLGSKERIQCWGEGS